MSAIELRLFLMTVIPCLLRTGIAFYWDFGLNNFTKLVYGIVIFIVFTDGGGYQPYLYILANKYV
jgi:hypothetical protein